MTSERGGGGRPTARAEDEGGPAAGATFDRLERKLSPCEEGRWEGST